MLFNFSCVVTDTTYCLVMLLNITYVVLMLIVTLNKRYIQW